MKKILAMILAAMMVFSLAACKTTPPAESTKATEKPTEPAPETTKPVESKTEAPTPTEPIHISFWDENAGAGRTEYYEELIKMFEAENPDIKIDYFGLVQEEALTKFMNAIETGQTPDVAGIQTTMLSEIMSTGHLVDIEPYCQKWDEFQYITKSALDLYRVFGNGKLCLLPRTNDCNILWVNKTYMDKYGVKNPEYWKDFFDALPLLNHPEEDIYAYTIRGGNKGASEVWCYMYDYIGSGELLNDQGYSTCNQPELVNFVDKYAKIYKNYTAESDITYGYKEMTLAFDNGSAAMFLHNLGSYPNHAETFPEHNMEFEACPMPRSDFNGKIIRFAALNGTAMFDTCPEEEREAAFKWLSYLSSHEGNSVLAKGFGGLPINSLVMEDDWVKEAPHVQMSLKMTAQDYYVETMNLTYLPGWKNVSQTLADPEFAEVCMGSMTAQQFMDNLEERMNELIDEYNASK